MNKNIEKRVEQLEEQINPKSDWTKTITSIYVFEGKEYKPNNPSEESTITIVGMHPGAI